MRLVSIPVLVALLCAPALARADGARTTLAQFFAIEEANVTKATGYRLAGVRDYTEVIVGAYTQNGHEQRVVALLRCGPRVCKGARVWLGPHETDLLGLVDLAGAPGPLGGGRIDARSSWTTLGGGRKKLRFPVLVFETRDRKVATGRSRFREAVTGTEAHHDLVLVSLRRSDERSPKIATLPTVDLYPSGAGTTATYTLAKGSQRAALDIVATEQRYLDRDLACIKPEPVEARYVLVKGRYARVDPLLRKGCH
ncbi:MAG: hypothetical protein K8M05_36820 [Deltaproteobacteria bacterium]|nr:hypothetical protein [Kofleriaceae bacterium]